MIELKQIWSKLYLGLAVLGLSAPLQVHAAGQDSVMLGQDGNQVSVSLEMSNAAEEKITTVAVSLEVKTENSGQISVDFQFAPELDGTEHGFVYNKDTGRLDIYVASADPLFAGEKLNLGNVQVQPADPEKSVSADISYCQNSFQTANGSYGDKSPVVEGNVPPVSIQVGNGTLAPPSPGPGTSGPGNNGTGSGNGSGNHGGESNRDQGLYDETTRFTNDPSTAQKIPSSVIEKDGAGNPLFNLSTGAAATIGGKKGTGVNLGLDKVKDKVSVISPEKGPSSILVSGSGNGELAGFDSWLDGGNEGELFAEGAAGESNSEEILLDQKNGGAVENQKGEKRKRIILFSAIVIGILLLAGGIILFVIKRKNQEPIRRRKRKKRRRRRRKKKPTGRRRPAQRGRRPTDQGRRPVRKRRPKSRSFSG